MLDYEMLDALWRSLSYLYIQCNSPKLIVCIVVLWHIRQKCIHSLIKHDCSHPCLLVDRRHSMKPWGGMCITSAVTHVNVSVYVFITLQPDFTIFGFIASCWSWDVHTLYFFFQAPFTVTRVSVSRETAGSTPLAVNLEEMHGRKIVALLWQPQPCWFPGCFVPALGVSHRHTHFTVYMRCNGPLINSKTIPTHSKSKSCDVSKKSDKSTVISDNVTLIFFSLLTNNEMLRKHLWSI